MYVGEKAADHRIYELTFASTGAGAIPASYTALASYPGPLAFCEVSRLAIMSMHSAYVHTCKCTYPPPHMTILNPSRTVQTVINQSGPF